MNIHWCFQIQVVGEVNSLLVTMVTVLFFIFMSVITGSVHTWDRTWPRTSLKCGEFKWLLCSYVCRPGQNISLFFSHISSRHVPSRSRLSNIHVENSAVRVSTRESVFCSGHWGLTTTSSKRANAVKKLFHLFCVNPFIVKEQYLLFSNHNRNRNDPDHGCSCCTSWNNQCHVFQPFYFTQSHGII